MDPARIRIGISGWTYDRWRGTFFPAALARRHHLRYAAEHFGSIEINGTFYGLMAPDDFARFHDETPDDFVFAIKGSRFITHMLRGRDVGTAMANFFASGVLRLGTKCGPFLWQFPERHVFDPAALARFFATLPRDMDQMAHLAAAHDERPRKGSWTQKRVDGPLRHAIEIRSESFAVPAFVDLLREHDVALVCADTVAVAPAVRRDERLRLLPAARIAGALRERLRRRGPGHLGATRGGMGRRPGAARRSPGRHARGTSSARRLRLFRQRCEGQGAGRCREPAATRRGPVGRSTVATVIARAVPFGANGVKRWCRRRDSNSHSFRHYPLKIACLPISPRRHVG